MGFSFILSWMPVYVRHGIGRWIGAQIYQHNNKRRHVVMTNLRIAFPDLTEEKIQEKALVSLQWYSCAMVDYCILFFSSNKKLQRLIRLEGKATIDQAINQGENIIILLMHSAWLDFAPVGLGFSYSLYGSYKPVKNLVLDWMMAKSRCRHVDFVISREEGMFKLVRSLKPGRLLIFLPDEDLGAEHADFAPFFGKNKATLNTPERIAKLKKATCFPCYTYYDKETEQYCINLGDALAPFPSDNALKSMEVLNKSIESMIQIEPDQYMWLLKLYRTTQQDDTSVY